MLDGFSLILSDKQMECKLILTKQQRIFTSAAIRLFRRERETTSFVPFIGLFLPLSQAQLNFYVHTEQHNCTQIECEAFFRQTCSCIQWDLLLYPTSNWNSNACAITPVFIAVRVPVCTHVYTLVPSCHKTGLCAVFHPLETKQPNIAERYTYWKNTMKTIYTNMEHHTYVYNSEMHRFRQCCFQIEYKKCKIIPIASYHKNNV